MIKSMRSVRQKSGFYLSLDPVKSPLAVTGGNKDLMIRIISQALLACSLVAVIFYFALCVRVFYLAFPKFGIASSPVTCSNPPAPKASEGHSKVLTCFLKADFLLREERYLLSHDVCYSHCSHLIQFPQVSR